MVALTVTRNTSTFVTISVPMVITITYSYSIQCNFPLKQSSRSQCLMGRFCMSSIRCHDIRTCRKRIGDECFGRGYSHNGRSFSGADRSTHPRYFPLIFVVGTMVYCSNIAIRTNGSNSIRYRTSTPWFGTMFV